MWKNLLPQGTRTVELCSGIALVLIALSVLTNFIPVIPELATLDSKFTWTFVFGIFGAMQIYSIYVYARLELLRVILSWCTGCIWIWLAVMTPNSHFAVEDISTLMLGVGNLYGFIINFNLLNTQWTD